MGPLSSVFDLLTFALLLVVFHATPDEFRTTWFLESMATQILVVFIIRTNGPFWTSRPHFALTTSSLLAFAVAMVLPFAALGGWFGFVAPGWSVAAAVGGLVAVYLACAEFMKRMAVADPANARSTKPLDHA
jgi:Mg2+-importing ATPase